MLATFVAVSLSTCLVIVPFDMPMEMYTTTQERETLMAERTNTSKNQMDHHRILIANNGMSALKFCLSMKHRSDVWIVGISNSSVEAANYEYLDSVHQIVRSDQENVFMDPEEIVRCAVRVGATYIFPGWGYLSESNTFADLVTAHGLVFMGPTSETLLRLGNKIECAHVSDELGISSLPWSKDAVDSIVDVRMHAAAGHDQGSTGWWWPWDSTGVSHGRD